MGREKPKRGPSLVSELSFFCTPKLRPSLAIAQPIKRGITAAVMAAEKPPLPPRFFCRVCPKEEEAKERERAKKRFCCWHGLYIYIYEFRKENARCARPQ